MVGMSPPRCCPGKERRQAHMNMRGSVTVTTATLPLLSPLRSCELLFKEDSTVDDLIDMIEVRRRGRRV